MLRWVGSAGFENMAKTDQVRLNIDFGVGQRITNTRLRRQMHHLFESVYSHQVRYCPRVGDIEFLKLKAMPCAQALESVLFELRAVIVVQVVDADHLMP